MIDNLARAKPGLQKALREFIRLESAGGMLLLIAAIVAMILANSPIAHLYQLLLETRVAIVVGDPVIDKPLLLWINDGLMAVFFFLVGLEIKREFVEGELSNPSQIILPALGAAGGMLIPAGIYVWMNWGDPIALEGWAIPVATDIAFALGLLSVFGSRVPTSLKVFLLTLAIFDDLAAIVIIALFYTDGLSLQALSFAIVAIGTAAFMNKMGVTRVSAYILIGYVLWLAVLKSGVHATLAGVLIALCVPVRDEKGESPLRALEHDLHIPVAFVILPVFALANAGVNLSEVTVSMLTDSVTLGIVLGLVAGKPLGILLFIGTAVSLGLIKLPKGMNWLNIIGVSFACGIGFTMSLFIAGLAFDHGGGEYYGNDRLGILLGSMIAAVLAFTLLHLSLPKTSEKRARDTNPTSNETSGWSTETS